MKSLLRTRTYWGVLVAQVFLIFLAALMKDHIVLYILFVISLFGIYGSVIVAIWQRKYLRFFTFICGFVGISVGLMSLMPGLSNETMLMGLFAGVLAYAAFVIVAILAISKNVFVTDKVTADRIVGSICIYLLIGMFFAFIYTAIMIIWPQAYSLDVGQLSPIQEFRELLYFSYITLTTVGYGDIIPTMPFTRILSCMEAVIGPIYLAIMVARLVGMHISQAHSRHE